MKTLTGRKAAANDTRRQGDPRPSAATIRDGSGEWSAGLWNEAHAALLGRIAGLMPQVDELMGDLTGRLIGDASLPGRTILRGLASDAQRVRVLRALVEEGRESVANAGHIESAVAGYAAARRRWRAYIHGLWYTHENGRTFLAAPRGIDAATFLVAREVKIAELEGELAKLSALGAVLPRLQGRRRAPEPTPRAEPAKPRRLELARVGRAAPKGAEGTRRPRTPGARPGDFAV